MKKLSRAAVHEGSHSVMIMLFNHEITEINLAEVKYRTPSTSPREIVPKSVRSITDAYQNILISSAGMIGEYLLTGPNEFWKHNFPLEMSGDYICVREAVRQEALQGELKQILILVSQILSLPSMIMSVIGIASIIDQKKVVDHTPTTARGERHLEVIRDEILYGIENTEFKKDEIIETHLSALQDDPVKEKELPQLYGTADLINQIVMSISEGIGE